MCFQISESQKIQIIIDEHDKINVYGYVRQSIHPFDEVEVVYVYNEHVITLAKDIIRHIIATFVVQLEQSLEGKLQLDSSLTIGKVGYFFSKETYLNNNDGSEEKDDIFPEYWVWSSLNNMQTWLYNVGDTIYLEISPTYEWLFSDLQEGELSISFDEYMNAYKPIVIVELQRSLVQLWINQCHVLLQEIKIF